jgi:hypothetical protein
MGSRLELVRYGVLMRRLRNRGCDELAPQEKIAESHDK